jgi:hypothetical protein
MHLLAPVGGVVLIPGAVTAEVSQIHLFCFWSHMTYIFHSIMCASSKISLSEEVRNYHVFSVSARKRHTCISKQQIVDKVLIDLNFVFSKKLNMCIYVIFIADL